MKLITFINIFKNYFNIIFFNLNLIVNVKFKFIDKIMFK